MLSVQKTPMTSHLRQRPPSSHMIWPHHCFPHKLPPHLPVVHMNLVTLDMVLFLQPSKFQSWGLWPNCTVRFLQSLFSLSGIISLPSSLMLSSSQIHVDTAGVPFRSLLQAGPSISSCCMCWLPENSQLPLIYPDTWPEAAGGAFSLGHAIPLQPVIPWHVLQKAKPYLKVGPTLQCNLCSRASWGLPESLQQSCWAFHTCQSCFTPLPSPEHLSLSPSNKSFEEEFPLPGCSRETT